MSSTTVFLSGEKSYVREWSGDMGKYMILYLGRRDLLKHLWEPVELRNFRVRDALEIMNQDAELWGLILQENFLRKLLEEHHRLVEKYTCGPAKRSVLSYSGEPMKPFDRIVVSLFGEVNKLDNASIKMKTKPNGSVTFERKLPKKRRTWREYNRSFDVVGYEGKKRYGIDFCPLESYWNARVVFEPDFRLSRTDYTKKHELGDCVSLGKTWITVLELFKALVFEFTFHGSPEAQAYRARKLHEDVEDYKQRKRDAVKP